MAARHEQGWIAWYWREGLHLLLWRRLPESKTVIGAEIERVALLARIVGDLPASGFKGGRMALTDSKGDGIYQWGDYELSKHEAPKATVPLGYPLDSLRLRFHAPSVSASGIRFSFLLSLGTLGVVLLALAAYFYREHSREMRDAANRVGFVTQVSHELKTPLTNIRLYAELLLERLDEEAFDARKKVSVIVSESQRLSRLISNILTFSKSDKNRLEIRKRHFEIDDVIRDVLEQFGPALTDKGIEARFRSDGPRQVFADPDSVAQILSNLVSNVEKYGDGELRISTSVGEGVVFVTVADDGPGIPRRAQERIFHPFYRVHGSLSEGVSGTGIGLSIARSLADLNGGTLELILGGPEKGTCFRLRLPTGDDP